jgi:hypothetical protein
MYVVVVDVLLPLLTVPFDGVATAFFVSLVWRLRGTSHFVSEHNHSSFLVLDILVLLYNRVLSNSLYVTFRVSLFSTHTVIIRALFLIHIITSEHSNAHSNQDTISECFDRVDLYLSSLSCNFLIYVYDTKIENKGT